RLILPSFILIALLQLPLAAQPVSEAERLNNEGLRHMDARRFAEAVAAFTEAERLAPTEDVLRLNRGLAYNGWGVALAGEEHWKEAIDRLQTAHALVDDRHR